MQKIELDMLDVVRQPTAEGYRLHRVEVRNWGTFHDKVWALQAEGDSVLLTGDVGSGKSTLVDAILTLLVPPQKITYNKAADTSAKERDLNSYVRGYYGKQQGAEGRGEPLALRNRSQYTVLLACFHNATTDAWVTLAQVFYYPADEAKVKRFYCIATEKLGIITHFSQFGSDMKTLRARLKNQGVAIHENYPAYGASLRKRLGNLDEQAINLFAQTVFMKEVRGLTDFVRQNMLTPDSVQQRIDALLSHYQDLRASHQAVLTAKRQIELLLPLEELAKKQEKIQNTIQILQEERDALSGWMAREKERLYQEKRASYQEKLQQTAIAIEQLEAEQATIKRQIGEVVQEIIRNDGMRLQQLERNLIFQQNQLETAEKEWEKYKSNAICLQLPLPTDKVTFLRNQSDSEAREQENNQKMQDLQGELQENAQEYRKQDLVRQETEKELRSLCVRNSNISQKQYDLRQRMCDFLGIPQAELPFVGELVEVLPQARAFEGAIERLLHGFALSLLVPTRWLPRVTEWLDHQHIGMKLVYYHVKTQENTQNQAQIHPNAVPNQLAYQQDSPYIGWVQAQMAQRFDHVCCENLQQFAQEKRAILPSGQMKSNIRHEKDDRFAVDDRRQYVLGFSNAKKRALLQKQLSELQVILQKCKKTEGDIRREIDDLRGQGNAISRLQQMDRFESIHLPPFQQAVEKTQQEIADIQKNNDVLQYLQQKQRELEEKEKDITKAYTEQKVQHARLDDKLREIERKQADNAKKCCETPDIPAMERLDAWFGKCCKHKPLNLENCDQAQLEYSQYERKETEKAVEICNKCEKAIEQCMHKFRQEYAVECQDWDDTMASLREYLTLLRRLKIDDLPRHEKSFKRSLQKNMCNEIAGFHNTLVGQEKDIREKIRFINSMLQKIPYNPNRYIAIVCEDPRDQEVRCFRTDLKNCTKNATEGWDTDQIAQERFDQIEEILGRLAGRAGYTDVDAKWSKKVTDVRNWLTFSAQEKWVETGEIYEHYTDSNGKSGGQKEKLAYTILAAGLAYNYQFGKNANDAETFRFVAIDEAFLKSSDASAKYGLDLFRQLGFQLLIVTPLLKIPTIEPYIANVGYVSANEHSHQSALRNIPIAEYQIKRKGGRLHETVDNPDGIAGILP